MDQRVGMQESLEDDCSKHLNLMPSLWNQNSPEDSLTMASYDKVDFGLSEFSRKPEFPVIVKSLLNGRSSKGTLRLLLCGIRNYIS